MALDNFRRIDMQINRANDYQIETQFAKEGDYNGRELVVQITNAGEVSNQSGVSLNLGWHHNSAGNSGLDPFTVVDASKGIFKITYPTEMLIAGDVTASIQIFEGEKITLTRNFKITVEKNPINEDAIVSENSFTVLQEALKTVNQYDNRIASTEKYIDNVKIINVRDYGAKGDGVTDDTQAFQEAIEFLTGSRVSPPGQNGWGLGSIYIPRGKYVISGTLEVSSALGLTFFGDGRYATTLIKNNDSTDLFSMSTYVEVVFRDLSMRHEPEGDRENWSNTCFNLDGRGGGKNFTLERVSTKNFDTVVKLNRNVNEDFNNFTQCGFSDCTTFLYARNSQAVVNKFTHISWGGNIDKVFDVYGFGYTHVDTASIIISGTYLNIVGRGYPGNPTGVFTNTNCKFEFFPQTGDAGTSVVIKTDDFAATWANVKFINSGIAGSSPDPNVFQFDLQAGTVFVEVDGGNWANCRIRTKSHTANRGLKRAGARFKNLAQTPSPQIERISGDSGSSHIPVIFENCNNMPNLTLLGGDGGITPEETINRNFLSGGISGVDGGNSASILYFDRGTHSFEHFGQRALVKKVEVYLTNNPSSQFKGADVKVYSDSLLTNQIGTLTIAGGTQSPSVHSFDVPPNTVISDGVFVVIDGNPYGTDIVNGRIYVETVSI